VQKKQVSFCAHCGEFGYNKGQCKARPKESATCTRCHEIGYWRNSNNGGVSGNLTTEHNADCKENIEKVGWKKSDWEDMKAVASNNAGLRKLDFTQTFGFKYLYI